MPDRDPREPAPDSSSLKRKLIEAKLNEKELLRDLAKARRREQLAISGYKAERKKRVALEKQQSLYPGGKPAAAQSFFESIISLIPNQMMIFTYHDGMDPKAMKYVWFKHARPDTLVSSTPENDPSGDFLADHIEETLLRERAALLSGIHESKSSVEHEYSVPRAVDAKTIVEKRLREWRKTTYTSLNGKDQVFAFVRDISALKQANLEAEDKHALKVALFENLKEMVFVSTLDGYWYDFNPAATDLLGYTPSELMRIKVEDLYATPKHRVKFLKEIGLKGYVKDFETIFRHKDGSKIPVMITATPFDLSGKGKVFQGVIRDISAIKKQEQLQGVLAVAGSVMHGFSQPLQTFSSLLDCMSEDIGYIAEGVGKTLKAMIESKLGEDEIKKYSQRLYDILLEPADPDNPSLNRTLEDLQAMKDAYVKMDELIKEIRSIELSKEIKKVEYSNGSEIVDLKNMGGFDDTSG